MIGLVLVPRRVDPVPGRLQDRVIVAEPRCLAVNEARDSAYVLAILQVGEFRKSVAHIENLRKQVPPCLIGPAKALMRWTDTNGAIEHAVISISQPNEFFLENKTID